MKVYERQKIVLATIVFFIIFSCPLYWLINPNYLYFWPYYHWELGFGAVPYTSHKPTVFITRVDGKPLSPPIRLNEYFKENNFKWDPTRDYLIQKNLWKKIGTNDYQSVKKIFEEQFLKRTNANRIHYEIGLIKFDPIVFYKKNKWIEQKIEYEDVYER